MNWVSDCCLAEYKLKGFIDNEGNEIGDVVLQPGQKPARCQKCGKDCAVVPEPKN